MEISTYVALSKQLELRGALDTVAHNMANASTPGFRSKHLLFKEELMKAQGGRDIAMTVERGFVRSREPGPLTQTGNPLDLTLDGQGWFSVETEQGIRYTRNGQFALDAAGRIVDQSGFPVLDANAQPITVPPEAQNLHIGADGTVYVDGAAEGRLAISAFERDADLLETGGGLHLALAEPVPDAASAVRQGFTEGSNVQPVLQAVEMTRIVREYEAMQRALDAAGELQRTAIQKIAGL